MKKKLKTVQDYQSAMARGGLAILAKYGRKHFSEMGKQSGAKRRQKSFSLTNAMPFDNI